MPRFPTAALLLVLTGLVAGCTVGPAYRSPAVDVPHAYRGHKVLAAGTPAAPAVRTDLAAWWTRFDDPRLGRFVEAALQQNLDLAQAFARVQQARAGLAAANAALVPSAGVAAQGARNYSSLETPLGRVLDTMPGFARYDSAYEANATASWELDLFGGLRRTREAADADYQASDAAAAAVRLAVAAQVADTYIQIRGLQARLGVAREQVRTQQQLRETVALRWKKGLAPELQLHQAEGALYRAQATVPPLEQALEAAMNALDVMLGTAPGTHRAELADPRPVPGLPVLALNGTPADLLRERPDLIAAERRLAASNARIGAAMAEYYPKISLTGLIGSATSVSSGNLFSGGAAQAGAVAGLRWRLFDFGRIDAQIEQARAQEAETLAAYRQAVLRATEDVENALLALDRKQALLSVLDQGADSLARARRSSGAAYDRGVVSLIEVLQADESLLGVQDAQAVARTESARAVVALFKALGGGWTAAQPAAVAAAGH